VGHPTGDTEIVIEPGKQDIIFKRAFDAPRDIVFRALTDPSLVPSYWGPRKYETIVDVMEPREGGRWRFINRATDGGEHYFKGVFHEVTPERIVQTSEYEGAPGHVALETATLEERDGKTYYTAISLAGSVEERDAVVESGMEGGARELYDRLDELVQELAKEGAATPA
jgi:uncharacterized protein YndB with AHSA1/START domain